MEKKLRVSGSVIGELSEKIPSPIIALNELIKNSYDAGAKKVSIVLDSIEQKLIISDDGDGMDESEIGILLQVAKSVKRFGSINPKTDRYTQGSKGLGFLSVFKFGDIVTWKTVKNKRRLFSINYQNILNLDDISDFIVPINEEDCDDVTITGTIIEIKLRNDFNSNQLRDYLSNQMNRDKILNSFIDNCFKIELNIDGQVYKTKGNLSLNQYYSENQLFYVTFSSEEKLICFEYRNHYKYGNQKDNKKIIKYNTIIDNRFQLSLELMIFDFSGTKRSSDLDKLFIIHPNKLTPLIYINKNLFNNYSLFDPELLRHTQSGKSLPQMVGYIEIISDDKDIQFNSDRTQFQENELTDLIRRTLEDINRLIQKSGSELKSDMKKSSTQKNSAKNSPSSKEVPRSNVVVDPKAKEVPENSSNDNQEKKTTNGQKDSNLRLHTPILKLRDIILEVPTQPISKKDFIISAVNSLGENIDDNNINIEFDNTTIPSGIIESIEVPCNKSIICSYDDPNTGRVVAKSTLIVRENSYPLETKKNTPVLIPNRAKKDYATNFKENPITNLIPQLNRLYSETKSEYNEVIACSLRALFELAIYELEISNKVEFLFQKKPGLEDKVNALVKSIYTTGRVLGEIKNGLGKPSYDDFRNELAIIDFSNTIKKCHLGAHKATNSLTLQDLESVGKEVGLFLVVVNEILNNYNIVQNGPWKIEIK